jgi:uncharacterized OB-fold protein
VSYPEPALTEVNRPLIEAWKRGELMLQHCVACDYVVFFPREMCPKCWSTQLQWKKHSGRGRLISYSHIYSHVTEPFAAESPVTLAEIQLDDGGTMLTRIVDADRGAQIKSGAAVQLVPMPEAARYTLPTFKTIP